MVGYVDWLTNIPLIRLINCYSSWESESRFPKLNECAHFHYELVELGPINVSIAVTLACQRLDFP